MKGAERPRVLRALVGRSVLWRVLAPGVLLLLLACQDVLSVQRAWPPTGSAQSALLVVRREDPPFGPVVTAIGLSSSVPLVYELPPGDPAPPLELTLILYDKTLAELGLPAGALPLAGGEGRSRALPTGGLWFRGGTAPSAAEWTVLDDGPAAFEDLRLEDQRSVARLCPPLTITRLDLGPVAEVGSLNMVLVLSDGRALIGAGADRLFVVEGTQVTPLALTSTVGSITGAYQTPDGELWLVGPPGHLYRGRVETGFRKVLATGDLASERWGLAGPTGDEPFELFLYGSARSFYRFDGQTLEQLRPPTRFDLGWDGGVYWSAPGVAWALGPSQRNLVHYDHGFVYEEGVPVLADDEVRNGGPFPSFGRVLATARGYLFQSREPDHWTMVGGGNTDFEVRALVEWNGEIFLGGVRGLISSYVPDFGLCEPVANGFGGIERAALFGDRILVLPDPVLDEDRTEVVLVER